MTDVKHGMRLWIRAPGDAWVRAVTGASQDPYLRSFNIWDGKRWQTISWGRLLQDEKGTESKQFNSYQVYLPNVVWNNTTPDGANIGDNPNYIDAHVPFAPLEKGWVRLFHTWPRTTSLRNQHWRIVPIFYKLPNSYPSGFIGDGPTGISSNQRTDMWMFWPSGARYSDIRTISWRLSDLGGYPRYEYSTEDEAFPDRLADPQVWGVDPNYIVAEAQAGDSSGKSTLSTGIWQNIQTAGLIDFQALKGRLLKPYDYNSAKPQSVTGADYVGQYDAVENMYPKRILLTGFVQTNYSMATLGPQFDPIDDIPVTFQLYANPEQAGELKWYDNRPDPNSHGNLHSEIRHPIDPRPQGTIIWEHHGIENVADQPSGASHERFSTCTYPFSFVWENPSDDNLTISASVLGAPPAADSYTVAYQIGVQLHVTRMLIHYAAVGYDTPNSTHNDFDATR